MMGGGTPVCRSPAGAENRAEGAVHPTTLPYQEADPDPNPKRSLRDFAPSRETERNSLRMTDAGLTRSREGREGTSPKGGKPMIDSRRSAAAGCRELNEALVA